MLMVGAKVLFNSAKMLKMGVLVVFMHDYGQQEALIDSKASGFDQGVLYYIFLPSYRALPCRRKRS